MFFVSLKYMATTKFNRAIDLQIGIARMAVLENIQSHTLPALVQIMAWRRPGDKPLSEPMEIRLLTHICVTLYLLCDTDWALE